MKYAVQSVMMADYTPEDAAQLIQQIGYDGVEWTVGYQKALWDSTQEWHISETHLEDHAKYIKELCDKHNLAICSLASWPADHEFERLERLCRAANLLDCPQLRVCVPGYNGKTHYLQLFQQTQNNLKTVQKIAQNHNLKALLEIHMHTILPSASSAYRLVEIFDPKYIGLIYDPGNMVHEGMENFQMAAQLLGNYLAHVHVKDYGWFYKQNKWTTEPMALSEGLVDWQKVLQALKSINYQGYLSFEDFRGGYCVKPEGITTKEKLKQDLQYLKNLEAKLNT